MFWFISLTIFCAVSGLENKPGNRNQNEIVYGSKKRDYDSKEHREDVKMRGGRYYYGGKFEGKCGLDGLYYRDQYSFVLCSNGNGYKQPCAPGTMTSGNNNFAAGYYYGYSDFCDINLVDYGYTAPKYGPGYSNQPSYGFAAYRYPNGHEYQPQNTKDGYSDSEISIHDDDQYQSSDHRSYPSRINPKFVNNAY